jgi:serine/threonine protein kinase
MSEGHSFSVDWWAFGILIYEMIYGAPPYYSKNQKNMFHDIINE